MNEKDVEKMELEVLGETLLDPIAERDWCEKQLKSLLVEEQQTIYSFRMFKALRDDSRMQSSAKTLKDIRGGIEYIKSRLENLPQ